MLVDVDFKAKHKDSKYLLTQDFYTLTQRSRRGTVIKTDDATSIYNFVSDPTKAQNIAVSAEQIKVYDEWRRQTFDEKSFDINALQDYLNESPLKTRVVPETTSPAGSPSGPTGSPSSPSSPSGSPSGPSGSPSGSPSGPSLAPATSSTPTSSSASPTSSPSSTATGGATTGPTSTTSGEPSPSGTSSSSGATTSASEGPASEPELGPEPTLEPTLEPTSSSTSIAGPTSDPVVDNTRAIQDFFYNAGTKPFNNLPLFKNLLVQLFPQAKLNRKNAMGQPIYGAPGVTKMEDYIKHNVINSIRSEIFKVYGQPGLDIFETILKNPNGFSDPAAGKKVHEAAMSLKPISSSPMVDTRATTTSSAGRKRVYVDCDTAAYFNILDRNSDALLNWLEQDDLNHGGLYQELRKTFGSDFFKKMMRYVSGHILHEGRVPKEKNLLSTFAYNVYGEGDIFAEYDNVDPILYLVKRSSSAKSSMLMARFYAKNNRDHYFDVPILLVNTNMEGEYTGIIKLKKKLSLSVVKDSKGNETWMTVDQLRAENPNLSFVNTIGILVYEGDEHELDDLDEDSQKFVQRKRDDGKLMNVGKPLLAVTANDKTRIDTIQSARAYETEDGKTIKDYNNVALIGIQCAIDSEQFLSLLNEARGDVLNSTLTNYSKGRITSTSSNKLNSNENTMTSAVSQSHDVSLMKIPGKKAGEEYYRQIISYNHAGQLIAGLLRTNKSAAQMARVYLNPSSNEIRGIEISSTNKQSFIITTTDGQHLVFGTLDNAGFHEDKRYGSIDLRDTKYQND